MTPQQPGAVTPAVSRTPFLRRYLLEDELRAAERAAPAAEVGAELELARRLLDAAELVLEFPELRPAAFVLLRDACVLLRDGSAVAADTHVGSETPVEPAQEAESQPANPALLERFAAMPLPELARMEPAERDRAMFALRDRADAVLGELEASSLRRRRLELVRRVRLGLLVTLVLAVIVGLSFAAGLIGPAENLALERKVIPSSEFDPARWPSSYLVDGNTDDVGVHTALEHGPGVTIDLAQVRTIERVVVYNRIEHRERALPLVVEVSEDGRRYRELARRRTTFEKWVVSSPPVPARFVRLRADAHTYLHLNEVLVH